MYLGENRKRKKKIKNAANRQIDLTKKIKTET